MENVKKIVPQDSDDKIDLYRYWKIFWRKKYYLLIPIILSLAISTLGVRKLTPVFESFTVISLEDRNILSSTMERYLSPVEERSRTRNRQFRAMIETRLKSKKFLKMIIQDLGLHRSGRVRSRFESINYPDINMSVEERVTRHFISVLEEKISVSSPMPGIFKISVFDSDPTTAYMLAKKVSNKYIQVSQQAQLQGLRQAGAFSDEQLAIYKEKLQASEKELARIKRELDTTEQERNPVNATNIHFAEAQQKMMAAEIDKIEIELKRVREHLNDVFGMIPASEKVTSNEKISNMEEQLIAMGEENLLTSLRNGEQPGSDNQRLSSRWNSLRNEISSVIKREYSEFSRDLLPLITEYFYHRFRLDYSRSINNKINVYISQYKKNMERRPVLMREYNRLSHEVETNRAIYQAFLESKTSTQISEAVQNTNLGIRINIVENAEKPLVPVRPNKLKIILLAVMFGGVCGVGAILVSEYMDDSFKTIDEVQRTMKLPVLGTVPKTVAWFPWEKKKRGKNILVWIISIFVLISLVSGSLYMYAKYLSSGDIEVELKETGEQK